MPEASHNQSELAARQHEFTAHIRDPQNKAVPDGIPERRMAVYVELLYNNIEEFLCNFFPVLRSLHDEESWEKLVRDFFANYRCQTPYFLEISQEFLDFLQNKRDPDASDPPFMLELAHYEWVELALDVSEEVIDFNGIDHDGDLLEGILVLSPLAWNLAYQYEVHRIGEDYQPQSPGDQPTHLVVYRDTEDEVRFMEINPVTARLLQLLEENEEITGRQAMQQIADELQHPNPETVIQGGVSILQELKNRDIVLGTRQ
jgi:hypothetical protein